MADLVRTYVIPLRRAWLKTQRYKRAPKATRTVAAFIAHHMKSEDVRVTPELNHLLWAHGIKNPPCRVKVDAKKDDKGVCVVQISGKPFPVSKEVKKEEGLASKVMDRIKSVGKKEEKPKEADVVKAEKKEATPAPKPATPAPKPAPKPAAPTPPAPKPVAPKPVAPSPKPATPAPKPAVPKPAEPKKETPPLRLK